MQNVQDEPYHVIGDLPARSIDTGMGLDRVASVMQGVSSVFDIDTTRHIRDVAAGYTRLIYGEKESQDVSLRILADHARAVTFLIGDGVIPSNDGRGYVLRRLLRRAVRHAWQYGGEGLVFPALVEATVDVMGDWYRRAQGEAGLHHPGGHPGGRAIPAHTRIRAPTARHRARRRPQPHPLRGHRLQAARHLRVPHRADQGDRRRARSRGRCRGIRCRDGCTAAEGPGGVEGRRRGRGPRRLSVGARCHRFHRVRRLRRGGRRGPGPGNRRRRGIDRARRRGTGGRGLLEPHSVLCRVRGPGGGQRHDHDSKPAAESSATPDTPCRDFTGTDSGWARASSQWGSRPRL